MRKVFEIAMFAFETHAPISNQGPIPTELDINVKLVNNQSCDKVTHKYLSMDSG